MYKACSVPILTENDKNCPLNKKHENDEAPPLDLPFTSLIKKKKKLQHLKIHKAEDNIR